MALDKAIKNGKEYRRKYRSSKAFDKTCRNYGFCKWYIENRTIKISKD